jgi:hypothetical protein
MLLCSPVVILMFVFLVPPSHPLTLAGRIAGAVTVLAAADLVIEGVTSVRRVVISENGVTFHYLFHKEFGAWADLGLYSTGVEPDLWGIARVRRGSRWAERRGHRVTTNQVRAIIAYPTRPRWDIPERSARLLGVGSESRSVQSA